MNIASIEAFFVDIDSTITDPIDPAVMKEGRLVGGNPIISIIKEGMLRRGWDSEKAEEAIESYAKETIWWDYPDFIAMHDLPSEDLWCRIYEWHDINLKVYDDTVEAIKKLHSMGKKLFVISNNPVSGCLLKLQKAGLADLHGSKYFCRIFATNIIRGCKDGKDAWKRAFVHIAMPAEKTAVIGDNKEQDADIPISCGAGASFIIKRDMPEPVLCDKINKKIIYVNNPLNIFKGNCLRR